MVSSAREEDFLDFLDGEEAPDLTNEIFRCFNFPRLSSFALQFL